MEPPTPTAACQYYVDEAGDGVLFNRHGTVIVGVNGCSRRFMLGLLEVKNPAHLQRAIDALRVDLLADPYYSGIPSMQPEQRKTALAFHAKDDIAEVRRDVYKLLVQHEVRFFAVVRDKKAIVEKVLKHCKKHPGYRYHENQLYDKCASRLFKERLHKEASYAIHFSARGSKPRTEHLRNAIEQARSNMRRSWNVEVTPPIELVVAKPALSAGLQAVDYFLWVLQRLYTKGESRYWDYIANQVSLVHDVDDQRNAEYGEYYTKSNPIGTERIPE